MAYFPPTGSVVAFQSDPTKLVGTVSVIGTVGVSGNPSVSGTVNVGNFPTNPSVSGTVLVGNTVPVTLSGNPSISGTVQISGNPSISGTVLVGNFPTNQNVSGSVVSFPGVTAITSLVSTIPSSVIVGASIFGQLPAGTAVLGSIAALQGTTPWTIGSVYGNISGSVAAFLSGTQAPSIYGMRNDAVASFLGADLTVRPIALDSAGRALIKPFSPEESRIEGYNSVVSTSVTTLVAAAGAGLRNYVTDAWFANTGSVATLITLKDGAGSILGFTIAPGGGGSNIQGLQTPIRTGTNTTFDFQPTTAVSVLYATVKGFKAP